MRRLVILLACALIAVGGLGVVSPLVATAATSTSGGSGDAAATTDVYTPVIAQLLGDDHPRAVKGTDGKYHALYELVITNARPVTATIQSVTVVDAADTTKVIEQLQGADLLAHLRSLDTKQATDATIEPNGTRILLVDLDFATQAAVPKATMHTFSVLGQNNPGSKEPTAGTYTITKVPFDGPAIRTLAAPLRGDHWVVTNGCCGVAAAHRKTILPVNGALYDAQRWAIDYLQLDAQGHFFEGDEHDVKSYDYYGTDIHSVASGVVVGSLDGQPDQVPGQLPDPSTINVQNVDGNHVVVDIGGGQYVFYAHMVPGSVAVKVGDKVTAGQVLGKLGNTGNTSAPHLHIHVMNSASVLGSMGLPYVIGSFQFAGQVDGAAFAAATGVEGDYGAGVQATPEARTKQFPLDLNIVDFPAK